MSERAVALALAFTVAAVWFDHGFVKTMYAVSWALVLYALGTLMAIYNSYINAELALVHRASDYKK
jgi:hypothetical protein